MNLSLSQTEVVCRQFEISSDRKVLRSSSRADQFFLPFRITIALTKMTGAYRGRRARGKDYAKITILPPFSGHISREESFPDARWIAGTMATPLVRGSLGLL